MAQRRGLCADEHPGAVRPRGNERPFPGPAAQHVLSQLAGPPRVAFLETERMQGTPGELISWLRKSEQLHRKRIRITQIPVSIRHHDGRLDLLKDGGGR